MSFNQLEDIPFTFRKIDIAYSPVQATKSDGTMVSGEFAAEMFLLPDGRANGGWGLWEHGSTDVLTLYRVVEGRQTGPSFTFKAQRLSPAGGDEITITVSPIPGQPPQGTVTFFIDGLSGANGAPLSLEANGRVSQHTAPTRAALALMTDLVFVHAEPQTVLVFTVKLRGNARFEHFALVFPSGDAIGSLVMSRRDGSPLDLRIRGGRTVGGVAQILFATVDSGTAAPPPPASPLPVLIVIADRNYASEPCRIYDIAGTNVGVLHFEADSLITHFRIEPR